MYKASHPVMVKFQTKLTHVIGEKVEYVIQYISVADYLPVLVLCISVLKLRCEPSKNGGAYVVS